MRVWDGLAWLGLWEFRRSNSFPRTCRAVSFLQGFRGQVGGKRLWQALYGRSWTQRLKIRESSDFCVVFLFEDAQACGIHLKWPALAFIVMIHLCQSKCLNRGRSRLITIDSYWLRAPGPNFEMPWGVNFVMIFFMLAARYEWQGAIAKDALRICLCRIWWRWSWRQRHFAMRKSCYLETLAWGMARWSILYRCRTIENAKWYLACFCTHSPPKVHLPRWRCWGRWHLCIVLKYSMDMSCWDHSNLLRFRNLAFPHCCQVHPKVTWETRTSIQKGSWCLCTGGHVQTLHNSVLELVSKWLQALRMFGGGGAGMNPWIVEKTQRLRVLLEVLQNLSYGGERLQEQNSSQVYGQMPAREWC